MLSDQGDLDALKTALGQVPPAAEGDPEIWKLRGTLKEKDRDWAGAAEDYTKALQINPYARGCHYRLAMVEQRLGHPEEAARYRKQADEIREAQAQLRPAYATFLDAQCIAIPVGQTWRHRFGVSRLSARLWAGHAWQRPAPSLQTHHELWNLRRSHGTP